MALRVGTPASCPSAGAAGAPQAPCRAAEDAWGRRWGGRASQGDQAGAQAEVWAVHPLVHPAVGAGWAEGVGFEEGIPGLGQLG